MKIDIVRAELARMASWHGVRGCALVDADTGMVWLSEPASHTETTVWEAAADYWRLHRRQQAHFAALGPLRVAALHHAEGMLAIFACSTDPELLLVAHADTGSVDWRAWRLGVKELGNLVGS